MVEAAEEAEVVAPGGLPVQEDGTTCTRYRGVRPPAVELVLIVEIQVI